MNANRSEFQQVTDVNATFQDTLSIDNTDALFRIGYGTVSTAKDTASKEAVTEHEERSANTSSSNKTPATFDADKEAEKIERLAKERLDTSNTFWNFPTEDGIEAAKKLCDEWSSLSESERAATANALTAKYHNAKMNALPIPTIVTNINGEMIGMQFDASFLDWHMGPSSIKLIATDGKVIESRNPRLRSLSENPTYLPDYIGEDKFTSK